MSKIFALIRHAAERSVAAAIRLAVNAAVAAIFSSTVDSQPACAQSANAINELISHSKLVDINRQVTSSVEGNKATISIYTSSQATDQDCKITSLLITKELRQHFRNIHRVTVLFYSPNNSREFKQVDVREGDVLLVDTGKPLKDVLAQLDVVEHKDSSAVTAASNIRGARSTQSAAVQRTYSRAVSASAPSGYRTWRSKEGDVSVAIPDSWVEEGIASGIKLFKFSRVSAAATGGLSLYRQRVLSQSAEDFVQSYENNNFAHSSALKRIGRSTRAVNGYSVVLYDYARPTAIGVDFLEKLAVVKGAGNYYMLTLQYSNLHTAEMDSIFNTVLSSLRLGT